MHRILLVIGTEHALSIPTIALEQEITNEYWCFPGLNSKGSSEMSKESYVKLNRKLHLALVRLLYVPVHYQSCFRAKVAIFSLYHVNETREMTRPAR